MQTQPNPFQPCMHRLQAACAAGLNAEALATLTELAARLVDHDHKEEAASLLAFVLHQGEAYPQPYSQAEDLWLDLEAALCPRVLWDARAHAREATWAAFMGELLDGDGWLLE